MLRTSIFVATVLLAGCPSTKPEAPHVADDAPLRIRIAQAEVKRAGGVAELVELARERRGASARARAARPRSSRWRRGPRVTRGGARGSRSEDRDRRGYTRSASRRRSTISTRRRRRGSRRGSSALLPNPGAIEALGRAGDASGQAALAACTPDRTRRATSRSAATAAARSRCRRRLRTALVAATPSSDVAVRYAATYALSREHEAPADDAVNAALAARIADRGSGDSCDRDRGPRQAKGCRRGTQEHRGVAARS